MNVLQYKGNEGPQNISLEISGGREQELADLLQAHEFQARVGSYVPNTRHLVVDVLGPNVSLDEILKLCQLNDFPAKAVEGEGLSN